MFTHRLQPWQHLPDFYWNETIVGRRRCARLFVGCALNWKELLIHKSWPRTPPPLFLTPSLSPMTVRVCVYVCLALCVIGRHKWSCLIMTAGCRRCLYTPFGREVGNFCAALEFCAQISIILSFCSAYDMFAHIYSLTIYSRLLFSFRPGRQGASVWQLSTRCLCRHVDSLTLICHF